MIRSMYNSSHFFFVWLIVLWWVNIRILPIASERSTHRILWTDDSSKVYRIANKRERIHVYAIVVLATVRGAIALEEKAWTLLNICIKKISRRPCDGPFLHQSFLQICNRNIDEWPGTYKVSFVHATVDSTTLTTHFSSVMSRLSEHEQFLSWDIFDLFDLIRWLEKENMLYMVSQNFRSYCNIHI